MSVFVFKAYSQSCLTVTPALTDPSPWKATVSQHPKSRGQPGNGAFGFLQTDACSVGFPVMVELATQAVARLVLPVTGHSHSPSWCYWLFSAHACSPWNILLPTFAYRSQVTHTPRWCVFLGVELLGLMNAVLEGWQCFLSRATPPSAL